MRIAIYSDSYLPQVNGVSHMVAQSALMLAERGHEVRVFAPTQATDEELAKYSLGQYTVTRIPSTAFWGYQDLRLTVPLGWTQHEMAEWQPDIIHAHTPFGAGREAVAVAGRLHVPLVGTHHTFFDHYMKHIKMDYGWAKELSYRLVVGYYNHCDLLVSPSQALADDLVAHGLVPPVEVVINPVDTTRFAPRPSQRPRGLRVLTYMGRLSYEKSIDQVLRAFALLSQKRAEVRLKLIGDGPERARLEELAAELGVRDKVKFTGMLTGEELVQALQASHLFITASKSENMPLSVLEGMAVGLPVVAANANGLPEVVEAGVSGELVTPDDPLALAAAVKRLLADRRYYQRLARGARAKAETAAVEKVATQLIAVYQQLSKQRV